MLLYIMSSEKNKTRSRILVATWELLEANEGNEIRMIDIARKAGISRQAVYLHFENRTDLLIATTRYIDDKKGIDGRLAKSRAAKSGVGRLDAFIEGWGNYIPEIYGVARVLMAARESDIDAAKAWDDRMLAVREGCEAVINLLEKEGQLKSTFSSTQATDILWTLLSVHNWVQLTQNCGWAQEDYVNKITEQARLILIQ